MLSKKLFLCTNLAFFCVLSCLYLVSPVYAKDEKPYKATTVDECIQEKECVWYAFSKQLGLVNEKNRPVEGSYIHKWEETLLFLATGDGKEYLPTLVKASEELGKLFPYGMRVDPNPKHLMIFSDDVERTLNAGKPKFSKMVGTELLDDVFKMAKEHYKGCLALSVEHRETSALMSMLTIIDINSEHADYCTAISFYNGMGLAGYSETQPFSLLSDAKPKELKFTKLDKFLLYLLYQPEFKSGQNIYQVKIVFDKVYGRTKKGFLEIISREKK